MSAQNSARKMALYSARDELDLLPEEDLEEDECFGLTGVVIDHFDQDESSISIKDTSKNQL